MQIANFKIYKYSLAGTEIGQNFTANRSRYIKIICIQICIQIVYDLALKFSKPQMLLDSYKFVPSKDLLSHV